MGQLSLETWDKSQELCCAAAAAAVKCKTLKTLPCQVLWFAIMDIETKHSSEAGALTNDPARVGEAAGRPSAG